MCRRLLFLTFLVSLVSFAGPAWSATVLHWSFDGPAGQDIVSDTDKVGGYVATAFYDEGIPDANVSLTYGEANPYFNSGGTSADFRNYPNLNDPGIGLMVKDPGSDSDLDLSELSACTIEAFVYPYVDRQQVIVRKYEAGDDPGVYYIDSRGGGNFAVRLAGNEQDITDTGGLCNDLKFDPNTAWYHVALVWDGSVVKFYVDGVQSQSLGPNSVPELPFTGPIGDSDRGLGIGCIVRDNSGPPPTSSGQFFHGRIDELRISDKALEPAEFLLYETGAGATRPDPKNRAENICDGVSLCWTVGKYPQEIDAHDIYFGTDWSDVNDADTLSGVYVGSQNLDANCFTPTLELSKTYYWRIDEVNDSNGDSPWKGEVWQFTTNDGNAYDPSPADERTAVRISAGLSWQPGCLAVSHDVYLGTDFNDVDEATSSSHPNVDYNNVVVNSHDPCGDYEFFTWYYWRVDEIGASSQRWRGTVWGFRSIAEITDVNFVAHYKLDERAPNDVANDSSGYEHHANVDGPDEGVNWDPNDGHDGGSLVFDDDTDIECPTEVMSKIRNGITVCLWLKDAYRDGANNWVFEVPGAGGSVARAAVVEDSTKQVYWRAGDDTNDVIRWDLDGKSAKSLEGWHFWAFVKNEPASDISIYFDGFVVESNSVVSDTLVNLRDKQMRFGVAEGHSNDFEGKMDDIQVYDRGLSASEIAAIYRGGDLALAWGPSPGDYEKEVPRDAVLIWRPGDYVVSHDVYFGTDWDDVNDATDPNTLPGRGRQEPNEYDPTPTGYLDLDATYYWRIDEVNDANVKSPWKGNVWRFRVANFLIVDDMETYNKTGNRIYNTWLDGYDNNSGAEVLLGVEPLKPVHGGTQSMDYLYDNADSKGWDLDYYSEISVDALHVNLKIQSRDWTEAGVKILSLFFYGHPDNDANEQMYAGMEDTRGAVSYAQVDYGLYGEDMNDVKEEEWHQWDIAMSDLAGVNPEAVGTLYIGFGIRGNPNPGGIPGGAGTVYFDNIRLYLRKCIPWRLQPVGDFTDDCVVNLADVGQMADEWLRTDACLPMQEPTVGPVAYWDYEEGDGNTVNDSINNYDGTAEGDYEWVAGRIGSYAMEFDGGWVAVPDGGNTPLLRLEGDRMSVTAWLKITEHIGDFAELVVRGRDNYETFSTEINQEDSGLTFFVRDANAKIYDLDSQNSLVEGEWFHIAGTYDGNNLTSYVNGREELTKQIGSIDLYVDANDGFGMAGRWDDTGGRFLGSIDEVRVYSYALSAEEVAWLGTLQTGYVPLMAEANIYDYEAKGNKVINFKDLDVLLDYWLDEKLWPPQ